ncbi:hypothetical protein HK105_200505 [Polyrhizophydium stewartii]|uniref:Dynein heavy chain n=1 Tax=Polyrhizophydium stewartii TaxID=2732419 RepID=A0ABR4NJA6_9FUNG
MSAVAPGSAALAAAGAQPGANADANAHTLGVGAGMTGGAGAVSFADPSDAGKLEAEIPDELKEYPPPESIASLDKQMDALLEDIKILLDARNKEFQISGESRTRMPLLPPISKFETFKTTRKDNLESILKVEIPSRKIGASEVIQKGMRQYWNIERYFEGDRLLDMLLCFYKEKAERLLQENRLLMSRWSRFCRTSFDISRFYPTFYKRNERLRIEFSDAATRYERLFEIHQARVQKRRAEMAAEEAARIDAERRGLAVLKNKTGLASSRKVERAEDKDERNVFSGIMDELSFFGPPELGQDPGFDVEDLAIYMRWLISIDKERRDLSLYLIRSKLILHKERNDLLEDYRFLDELKSGDEIVDSLEYFDNLNAYIDQPPIKTPRVEDLIAEYDLLVSHWDVETPINQEDGRPFAYEIDHKFFNNFAEQSLQFSLAPYEAIQVGSDPGDASAREGPAQHSGNSGLDELTNSLANLSGYTQKSNTKSTRFPKLRRATWLDSITLVPEFDESQAAYRRIVAQLVDTDMELRIEHDMLLSSDHEAVGVQLKEIAKRVWERAASEPNCKPHAVKISIIPQQREYKPPVDTETRQPHMFDLGMAVSEIKSDSLSSNILASKKKDYGLILKSNEENRKLEMELLNADPMRNIESSEVIQPTLATIFAEHEVFAYLQMRFIKIRELRVKLLRQFNYLRVIEKRLNLDMAVLAGQRLSETQVSAEAIIAKMWRRAEFLDMGSQGDEGRDKQPEPSESADLKGYASMETSSIVHGMIQVCDAKGTPFVYDVALADMEAFDTEMMHIVTLYINESRPDDHINPEYLDELRFRMSNRRTEMLNVTYLNPFADRSQIMLEFYEAHFAYQNAKIEVVALQLLNSYLEGYEHVTDITNAKELAHIITNIVHLKPLLNLQESYFGRSYAQSTKALELHSQLVVKCIRHVSSVQREWCGRYTPKSKPPSTADLLSDTSDTSLNQSRRRESNAHMDGRGNPKKEKSPDLFYDSILKIGLPFVCDTDNQPIIMHHPETTFQMTEVIPALENLVQLWGTIQSLQRELEDVVESLSASRRAARSIVDCAVLKALNEFWDMMADNKFQLSQRTRRQIGGLDSNLWLQNPYLPDALLSEYYVPYDQTDEGTYKSLGVQLSAQSFFNDASFQANGREILFRGLKVVVLRSRLLRTWIESENWRKAYEAQFSQMGVPKANFANRLGPLRFDAGNANSSSFEEAAEAKDAEEDIGALNDNLNDSETDLDSAAIDTGLFRLGPLAISELDELQSLIDVSNLPGITSLMRPTGILRLKQSIRIQLLEKNWLMAATELHNLLLSEIHGATLNGQQAPSTDKNQSQRPTVASATGADLPNNNLFDVDYRTLATTNLGKKKQLRRILMAEFSKEYKSLSSQDITENQKEQAIIKFKAKLIEWYCANMAEVVSQECERTEFAKLISEIRKTASNILFPVSLDRYSRTQHGKLIFLFSNITRHSDYFARLQDGGSEVDRQRYKQSVQTQEIVCNDAGAGAERLAKLWYLPHLTEIVLTMGGPDKPHKGAIDLSHRIFRNPQIFLKSAKIHSLIFEIYSIVSVFAHLLQDNRRYAASVKQLREADYVVSTMNLIKRDLLNQGEPADYTRVHNFLAAKWQFWFLKLKYAISSSINVLEMNMFNADRAILASHYAKCITKKFTYLRNPKRGKHEKPLSGSKAAFVVTRTFIPTSHVFGSLSPQAKRLCDSKVQEIDESIEEHFQLIQYNGSDEDMNKSLSDFLTFNIKLLALRREYFALLTGGQPIKNETMQAKIFQKYKMRIIVPSLRQYHKTGSKGTILLQDEIITGEGSLEINRVARGAFDRCQLVVLQNEIMRDYSAKMVRSAQEYFDKLTDERLGRLFRGSDTAGVNSPSDAPEFAFRISEEDYNIKMSIFNTFLSDLHHSSVEFLQDLKDKQTMAPTVKSGRHAQKADDPQLSAIFDDKKIFACNKEFLGRAIVRLATHLNQWKTDCVTEQEGFVGALYGHLLNTIRNFEQIILFQAQEKREMAINFRRESRLMAHEIALETFSEMASMSVELNEMRKSRKIDERKLRNKIIDEYDDLVQELTKEIGVLRHRFREYQIGNLNDVMNIMAEAKKEQLIVMTQNEELPLGMREAAEAMIQHEEQLASLREQNHELKMTVLKIRSMFTMKEQALKCYYERKLRKLSDANKEAEEKLWDNYRDAEARERTLRKQLTKLQKAKSTIEFQNELLQRQLREEQTKPRTNQTLKAGATAAQIAERSPSKGRGRSEAKSQKLTELEDRLRRYEGINIDNLIQELANKTALLEEMIQEKRDSVSAVKDGTQRRVKSARWNRSRSPSPTAPHQDSSTASRPVSGFRDARTYSSGSSTRAVSAVTRLGVGLAAAAAEPLSARDRETVELNSHMVDKMQELLRENKALRRKLFLNGIPLPPESRNVPYLRLGQSTPRHDSGVATSAHSRVASPERSASRPRTAATHESGGRRSAGILRNGPQTPGGGPGAAGLAGLGAELPPLERAPQYQRVGSAKQVGFASDVPDAASAQGSQSLQAAYLSQAGLHPQDPRQRLVAPRSGLSPIPPDAGRRTRRAAKNSTFAMSLTLSVHSKDVLLRIVAALSAPKLALAVEASAEQTGLATLRTKGGQTIQGPVSVAKYLLSQSGRTALLGASDEDAAQVDDWTHRFLSLTAPALKQDRQAALTQLNDLLAPRVFVVGSELTLADLGLYATLYNTAFQFSERLKIPNVIRFYDLIQHRVHAWQLKTDIRLVEFDLTVPFVPKPAAPADAKAKDAKGKDAKGKGKEPAEAAPTAADGAAADKGKKGKDAKADKPAAPAAAEPAKSAGGSSQGKKDKPAAAAAAAGSAADASLPDPSKLDIRVGTIVSVKRHPDADTLYVEEVDLGEDAPRTVVSGLVKYMTEDKLQDRKVVLLCNLKPAKMRGIESQAMVLATTSADGATVELLDPPAGSANGDIAYFDGYKGTPEKQLNSKKKVWESIQPNLQTDQKRQATYVVPDGSKRVCVLRTDRGVCTVKTVAGGSIK